MAISIVLVTTGRNSGEPREARLYAAPDGEAGLIVVASDNGKPSEPHWAANLRHEPRAGVRRGRSARTQPVLAREVTTGPERDRLWSIAAAGFPHYETMQRRSSRTFAVFLLEPAGDPDGR